jgi:hypothetical protein
VRLREGEGRWKAEWFLDTFRVEDAMRSSWPIGVVQLNLSVVINPNPEYPSRQPGVVLMLTTAIPTIYIYFAQL